MGLRCTDCGDDSKVFDNYRQARGHVKFKSGGAHGDAQELPSDWKGMIEEVEEGNGSDSDDADESSDSGSSSDSPDATDSATGSSDDSSSTSESGSSDDSRSGILGTVRKAIDTDVRELI